MRSFLIVDDSKTNRLILKFLLDDFAEENGMQMHIDYATNGQEAIDMAKANRYDIIFMDIMMPLVDGIEATKTIRSFSEDFIIAVSAVGDNDRKKEILQMGAQDYISKPVNADILFQRLKNYFLLIDNRKNISVNMEALNLFTHNVFKRQLVFLIDSEDSISQFWEFFNFVNNFGIKDTDLLADIIRGLYDIALSILAMNKKLYIVLEEDETYVYFTVNSIRGCNAGNIKKVLDRNIDKVELIMNQAKLSIKISKKGSVQKLSVSQAPAPTPVKEVEKVVVQQPKVEAPKKEAPAVVNVSQVAIQQSTQELEVYNYLEDEDFYELEEALQGLSHLLKLIGKSEIEVADVIEITSYLEKIGGILFTYSESYALGQGLQGFAYEINKKQSEFIEKSESIATLIHAFNNDLQTWFEMTFKKGAPSLHFMDDSILTNTQTIAMMLDDQAQADDAAGADLDDIFDF